MRNISVPSLLLLRPLIQSRLPFIWSSVSLGTDLQQRGIMASYTRFLLVCLAYLALGAQAFLASPGVITRRHAGNVANSQEATRSGRAASTTGGTTLFAKAVYKNFEEMLEKEPGALLVDFYATWCGPCKMMAETLQIVGPKMKDELKIFKIDSDKYPTLMSKFGVNGLPTLILFKNGKELQRMEGGLPADPLEQQLRYWLAGAETQDDEQSTEAQRDACAPAQPQDACSPPPRDACAPPPQE